MHTLTGLIMKNDINIFFLFNKKLQHRVIGILMRILTYLGSTGVSIAVPLVLLIMSRFSKNTLGIQMALTVTISQVVVQIVKRLVNRPRPYKVLKEVNASNPPACKYSFPSGHTCSAFSLALPLMLFLPGFGGMFLALAVLVGISRIYLGFHYPTDVIVGLFISLVSFMSVNAFLSMY